MLDEYINNGRLCTPPPPLPHRQAARINIKLTSTLRGRSLVSHCFNSLRYIALFRYIVPPIPIFTFGNPMCLIRAAMAAARTPLERSQTTKHTRARAAQTSCVGLLQLKPPRTSFVNLNSAARGSSLKAKVSSAISVIISPN